jgi:hypothetical protein
MVSSQFGLKKHVKNTGIYRYSAGGISVFGICDIDPLYVHTNIQNQRSEFYINNDYI